MVARPVGVYFGWVREVAVVVDQFEHKLLRAGLQGIGVFSRGEQYDELRQPCEGRRMSGRHRELDTYVLGDGRILKDGVDNEEILGRIRPIRLVGRPRNAVSLIWRLFNRKSQVVSKLIHETVATQTNKKHRVVYYCNLREVDYITY